MILLLSTISSESFSVFCSSEVTGKNSFSSNWKSFCFCNRVNYFPLFISSMLLLYYLFQFSNRYAMQVEAKPFHHVKKRVHTKRTTLHFFVRNRERFPLLLETNNAFRIVTQTYFNSEHTIDFCVVKVFMVLLETKKEFLKLTKRPWVRNDYIPNEQRCILLLETNNLSLCC